MKKQEPELAQVNQAVLQHLPPKHVEVEIWRADALEVRRGLSSELDEMWSYVRTKRIRAGYGTLEITIQVRCEPMCWDDDRTRSFWNLRHCWSRLALRAISPTAGVPTSGMWRPSSTRWGRHTRRRSEQTHQFTHADQAVGTSDDLFFQDGPYARLGDWAVYQSV